ncbi:unnamed protein product [Parnassius mnemosyne]|uniref:Reverse transcriptase RNase H-like domain-containing protein n=1 Tax=Parnassius mnemosyne TaxID=213953 RepID=A0AAV1L539_9NEOP
MVINTSKCVLGASTVNFLGYTVSPDGVKPLTSKVQGIKDFPVPKNVKELRRFLEMLNFYRRFVPGAAETLKAVYENIKYFRHMLEAKHFTIFTDHKPICYAFQRRKEKCSPRQFRYLDYISQFTTDIQHISGKENVAADTLSRIEELSKPVDLSTLAKAQSEDPELKKNYKW